MNTEVRFSEDTARGKGSISLGYYISKYKGYIILGTIFTLIETVVSFIPPILLRDILDSASNSTNIHMINKFKYVLASVLFIFVIRILYRYVFLKFSVRFKTIEMSNLLYRVFRIDLSTVILKGPTYYTERILSAINNIYNLVSNFFINTVMGSLTILISLVFAFSINFFIGLLFLVLLPLNYFSYKGINRKLQEKCKRLQEVSAHSLKNVVNIVQNIEEIKQLTNYGMFADLCKENFHRLNKENYNVNLYAKMTSTITSTLIEIMKIGVLILSIYLYILGSFSMANVIFVNMILILYSGALTKLNLINISFRDVRVAIEFIDNEITTLEEIDVGTTELTKVSKLNISIPSFSYPGTDLCTLHNLQFNLKEGDSVGIVGRSGAGKTTLIKLITRMYYSDGIYINGIPSKDFTLESLRNRIYTVSQTPYIFPGTVETNIALASNNDSEFNVEDILRLPFVRTLIDELPNGKDTQLGEGGCNLSGGQKQRIMLARLLMQSPDVVILDEATANIDSATESEFMKVFDKITRNSIVIRISHRLSSLVECEQLYVMKNGSIIASGSHEELLKDVDEYQDLFKSQSLK